MVSWYSECSFLTNACFMCSDYSCNLCHKICLLTFCKMCQIPFLYLMSFPCSFRLRSFEGLLRAVQMSRSAIHSRYFHPYKPSLQTIPTVQRRLKVSVICCRNLAWMKWTASTNSMISLNVIVFHTTLYGEDPTLHGSSDIWWSCVKAVLLYYRCCSCWRVDSGIP